MPTAMQHGNSYHALFDGYAIPGLNGPVTQALGYILCGITAIVIFMLVTKIISALINKDNDSSN